MNKTSACNSVTVNDRSNDSKTSHSGHLIKFAHQSVAVLLSGLLVFQTTLLQAQQVTPDTSAALANQPGVSVTPNGKRPLVDIVTPNSQGLSHNKYENFNVGEPGLVLNNLNAEVGNSALGDALPGNPNLKNSGPATLILNEVTKQNRSSLSGPIEVFGGRADVVIANPNGITCDGCGFINTPRATLTTGVSDIGADGHLNGFIVNSGDVTFGSRGGNFAADNGGVDLFDVVSRTVRVDGPVFAKDLRLTAGRNKFNYATGKSTALEAIAGAPEYAIDGSALGAMQANRIRMVVTEKGAGVRMRGDLAANTNELSLSVDGRINIGTVKETDSVSLHSKADVAAGNITSKQRVVVQAEKGITLQSVSSEASIALDGGTGLLTIAGKVTSLADTYLSASGGISAGSIDASGTASLTSASGNVAVIGEAKSINDLTISANAGSITAASLVSYNNLTLNAGRDVDVVHDILAARQITATGRSIASDNVASGVNIAATTTRADKKAVRGQQGDLSLTATDGAIDTAAVFASGLINLSGTRVSAGTVIGHGNIAISGTTNISGQIDGAASIAITGASITTGNINAGVDFAASGSAANKVKFGSAGTLTLTASSGTIKAGDLASAGALTASASMLDGQGITSRGKIDLLVDVKLTGDILGANDIAIRGKIFEIGGVLASGVDFAATTASPDKNVILTRNGELTINATGGSIKAKSIITAGLLTAISDNIAADDIVGHNTITLDGSTDISGRIKGARDISIIGRNIHAGSIVSGVDLAATGASPTARLMLGKEGNLNITAVSGRVDAGTLVSAGNLFVQASALSAMSINSHGKTDISGDVTVTDELLGAGHVSLRGKTVEVGKLVSGLDFDATAASADKTIILTRSGDLTIGAEGGTVKTGLIFAAGDIAATAETISADGVTGHGEITLRGNTRASGQVLGAKNVSIKGKKITADSIVSGVDFAESQNARIVLGKSGDLILTAEAGRIDSKILRSASDITVDASDIQVNSIASYGNTAITGNLIVHDELLGAGNVVINGSAIDVNKLVAGLNFAETNGSQEKSIVLTQSGDLTINAAGGKIATKFVTAAGDIAATAASISGGMVIGHKNITLRGNTTVDGQMRGAGNVLITGQDIRAGSIVSGVDFAETANAKGRIRTGASGDLVLDAGTGSVNTGALLSGGFLNVISGGLNATEMTSHNTLHITGDTNVSGLIEAASDLSITGPAIKAKAIASGVDFAATALLSTGEIILGNNGSLDLKAAAGSIEAMRLLSAGNMTVHAARNINGNAVSQQALDLTAGDGITLNGQSVSGTALSLKANTIAVEDLVAGVNVAAAKASPAAPLILDRQTGTMTLDAARGSITAKNLTSGGSLVAHAAQNITYDQLQSFGVATLAADQGSVSLNRPTLADGDVTLSAKSVDFSNNRSGIATGKSLIVHAQSANFAGSNLTYGGLGLTLSGNADFTRTTVSAITGDGGSGNINVTAAGIQGNSATALLAQNDLSLTVPSFSNAGQIAAGHNLTASIAGDFTNTPTGIVYSGNDTKLYVAGNLLNDQGAILAGHNLEIAANAAGARNQSITNISGVIRGENDGKLLTENLTNKRLTAPTWGNVLVSADAVTKFELNPDMLGKPYAQMFQYEYTDDYELLYKNLPPLSADKTLHEIRWSQAVLGDGSTYRITWLKENWEKFGEGHGKSQPVDWLRQVVPHDEQGNLILDPAHTSRYFVAQNNKSGNAYYTKWRWNDSNQIRQTIHEDRLTNSQSPEAMIHIGGNLTVDATTLNNSFSTIEAGGGATMRGSTLNNEGLALHRTTLVKCEAKGGCEFYDAKGAPKPEFDLDNGGSKLVSTEVISAAPATIKAAGLLDTSGYAAVNNTAVAGSMASSAPLAASTKPGDPMMALSRLPARAALFAPNAALGGVDAGDDLQGGMSGSITGADLFAAGSAMTGADLAAGSNPAMRMQTGTLAETLRIHGDALAAIAKPNSGGFGGTIPGQIFLYETRPAFLDVGKFYGSGYFINRIGYKPEHTIPFLGDAYFDNQLVDQQMRQRAGQGLGKGSFIPGSDAIEQMKLLLDHGIDYVRANNLAIGQMLTSEQMNSLTQSVVLYQKKRVRGADVLTPVVYLANTDKAKLTVAGALISGGSVNMDIGRLNNSGAIVAAGNLRLAATGIRASGGVFSAGGNLSVVSSGDLTLTAQSVNIDGTNVINGNGGIKAGGSAIIAAENKLTLQGVGVNVAGDAVLAGKGVMLDVAKVDNKGTQSATGTTIDTGGNLTIAANDNVNVVGSSARAGGALVVTATNGSVNVVTADVAKQVTGEPGNRAPRSSATVQKQSQLSSGTDTFIKAGDDILLSGSSIRAGGNTILKAADDVNITTAQGQSTSQGRGRTASSVTNTGSEITAGGSIAVIAGDDKGDHDINIVGSKLGAGEKTQLKAGGDVTIAEAQNSAVEDTQRSSRRIFSSRKSTTHTETSTAVGSDIGGGTGVDIISGGDTTISASKLQAGSEGNKADVNVVAEGNLTVASGKDTLQRRDSSSGKGFLSSQSSKRNSYDERNVASDLSASGNVSVYAGKNAMISGSNVTAGDTIFVEGDNVAIIGAPEQHALDVAKKKSGLFAGSGKGFVSLFGKEQKESQKSATLNAPSLLKAGNDAYITARTGDANLVGSHVTSGNDINVWAMRDVNILPGAESFSSHELEKRSGIGLSYSAGDGGASIGIGFGSRKDETRQNSQTNAMSSLAAGHDLNVHAGRDANLQAAQVSGENNTKIIGARNTNLLSAQDKTNYETLHQQLFAGVTLSVSSSLISSAETVQRAAQRVDSVSGAKAVSNAAIGGVGALQALLDTKNIAETGNIASGSLTAGFQSSKNTEKGSSSIPVPTTVRGGNSVTIAAISGDLIGHGAQILSGYDANGGKTGKAGTTRLIAGQKLALESAQALDDHSSRNTSAGANMGVGINLNMGSGITGTMPGGGFGLTGGANFGKGSTSGSSVTQLNSHVRGTGETFIQSGGDTVLKGAVIDAPRVTARVGGALIIESQLDLASQKARQLNLGGAFTGPEFSLGGTYQKADGDAAMVGEQSGIRAGTGGYDITVGGKTSIVGGLITSEANPVQNRLHTGTLEVSDLDTHSNWKARTYGATLTRDGLSGPPTLKEGASETGKAYSAISPGEIIITDPANQSQNLDNLRRDTANTNTSLPGLPDLQNVLKEQYQTQADYQKAAATLSTAIGKLATDYYKEAEARGDKAGMELWGADGLGRAGLHALGGAVAVLTWQRNQPRDGRVRNFYFGTMVGRKTLADIRGATCRAYAASRRAEGRKDATSRRELAILAAAIKHWHREHGPLESVPIVTLPPKPAARAHWLTRAQAALLLAGALGWYRRRWTDVATRKEAWKWARHRPSINRPLARFIVVGLYTGTRHGAILSLQWMANTMGGWIDLDRSVMHRRGDGVIETKKRTPPVRIGRRLVGHMRRWKKIDDDARLAVMRKTNEPVHCFLHVIASQNGGALQKMRKPWYEAREFAELSKTITPHILRHTRATWLVQSGIDLWEAAGTLGMSVQMLEEVYGHHSPDFQRKAAEV